MEIAGIKIVFIERQKYRMIEFSKRNIQ